MDRDNVDSKSDNLAPLPTPESRDSKQALAFVSELMKGPGRKAFRLEVDENGQLVELSRIETASAQGYSSMQDAAKYLRHSYHWLSRNWMTLGLNPKKVGRVYFFAQKDLDDILGQQRGPHQGRHRKMVRVVS